MDAIPTLVTYKSNRLSKQTPRGTIYYTRLRNPSPRRPVGIGGISMIQFPQQRGISSLEPNRLGWSGMGWLVDF